MDNIERVCDVSIAIQPRNGEEVGLSLNLPLTVEIVTPHCV